MAITKNVGRQEPLVAYIDIPYGDIVTAGEYEIIDLPYGATIISGGAVATGLTGVTDLAISVEDADGTELIADMAATYSATAWMALTITGDAITVPGYVKLDTTGTATAGSLRVVIEYIVNGRACVSEG